MFIFLSLFRYFLCDKILSNVIRNIYGKSILYGLGSPKEDYHNTLGISSQFFTLGLDSIFSFVNDEEYRNKSVTVNPMDNTTILYNDEEYQVEIINDVIYLTQSSIIPNFVFCYTKQIRYSSMLGLGFGFTDTKYSFVHLLKLNHIIDQNQFAIEWNGEEESHSRESEGKIYFGGIENVDDYNHSEFKAVNDIHSWGIFVKCVTLGNTVYIAKTNFVFNFTEEYFELPKGVFKLLREKYFSSFIRQKKCIENEEHIFSCLRESLSTIPDLILTFNNDVSISIPFIEFAKGFNAFIAQEVLIKESCKDYFIIGSHLLRLFRPLFNYDRETITLYTKLPVDNTHKTSLIQIQSELLH